MLLPLDLFKQKSEFFGLDAPTFLWIAAAFFVVWTSVRLGHLLILVVKTRTLLVKATAKLQQLKEQHAPNAREGLSVEAFDAATRVFDSLPQLKATWRSFASTVIVRQDRNDEDRYWASESASQTFTDAAIIDPRINRASFASFPGVLTGLGLLATFLAILVALLDVRLVNSRVQGLELLIEGLSGKFLSSISALLCASAFIYFEKKLLYALSQWRRRLSAAVEELMPRLSTARLLADLQRDIHEQSNAFRNFNSSLAPMLKQSFSESMRPTLDRMVTSIDDLNQHLKVAEARKDQTLAGTVEKLLINLESSLNASIQKMGSAFTDSLSGSAKSQFDNVAVSLKATASLLENMNGQFDLTQSALSDLINFARRSTEDQMALGTSQVQELSATLNALMQKMEATTGASLSNMTIALTSVVGELSTTVTTLGDRMTVSMQNSSEHTTAAARSVINEANSWSAQNAAQVQALNATLDALMHRMEETTGSSLAHMSAALTSVVGDLSEKVTTLGDRMTSSMKDTSEHTTAAARIVIHEANAWSEQNAVQLKHLLERHQNHLDGIVEVRKTLDTSLAAFKESLGSWSTVTTELRAVSDNMRGTVGAIEGASESTAQTHKQLQTVAGLTRTQIERLADANKGQEETWQKIQASMEQYQRTFGHVQDAANKLLEEVVQQLIKLTKTYETGFERLAEVGDKHFADATAKLGSSVDQLEEYLQDFTDALEKFRPNGGEPGTGAQAYGRR